MSQLESTDRGRGVAGAKPKPDIYTVLLGIALGAILLAILCLALELGRYDWDYKADKAKLRVTAHVPAAGTSAELLPVARA